jgi:anti-sigma28 factor (negative regulator of flagellin synthesis)
MTVIISPNLKKQSDFIDKKTGNIVDRKTGQVIEEIIPETKFTPPETTEQTEPTQINQELSLKEIKQMIQNTKDRLVELETIKEKKVAELKAELEDL